MIDDNKLPNLKAQETEDSKLPSFEAHGKKIGYAENPELSDAWFQKAKRATKLPEKKQVSLRIDEDILEFFKQQGSRYQTKMHAVLRAYVDGNELLSKK